MLLRTPLKQLPALVCLLGALLASGGARAQETLTYTEQVTVEGVSQQALQARAADWVTHHFPAGSTRAPQRTAASGMVTAQGTMTLKPVTGSGRPLERVAQFDFTFQARDQGYTYAVANFQVVADPGQPGQLVPFAMYVAQLRTEKNVDKTKNDKRVWAQATSLASDLAMQFRSYMNQLPAAEAPTSGLPAGSH